jgi:hypothetical protein
MGTFKNKQIWRDAAPLQRCIEMSSNGLYYNPNDEHIDRVVCAFCQLELYDWNDANERAHSAHQKYSSACEFIGFLDNTTGIYSHNVKLGEEQIVGSGFDASPFDR